jgi:hypothetical protein
LGEPAVEESLVLRVDVEESCTGADIGNGVDDAAVGVKRFRAGSDFERDESFGRKGIHHVEIAAVETEVADAGVDANALDGLDEFGLGREEMARSAAAFVFHSGLIGLGAGVDMVMQKRVRELGFFGERQDAVVEILRRVRRRAKRLADKRDSG